MIPSRSVIHCGQSRDEEGLWRNPKTKETDDFIDFCRSLGRFSEHFAKEGNTSDVIERAKRERLENWHQLPEFADII